MMFYVVELVSDPIFVVFAVEIPRLGPLLQKMSVIH